MSANFINIMIEYNIIHHHKRASFNHLILTCWYLNPHDIIISARMKPLNTFLSHIGINEEVIVVIDIPSDLRYLARSDAYICSQNLYGRNTWSCFHNSHDTAQGGRVMECFWRIHIMAYTLHLTSLRYYMQHRILIDRVIESSYISLITDNQQCAFLLLYSYFCVWIMQPQYIYKYTEYAREWYNMTRKLSSMPKLARR